MVYQQQGIR